LSWFQGYVKKSRGVRFRAKKGCLIAYGLKGLASALPLAGGSGATYSLIMFTAGAFFLPIRRLDWLSRIPECWRPCASRLGPLLARGPRNHDGIEGVRSPPVSIVPNWP
jgi:hypothetical protein